MDKNEKYVRSAWVRVEFFSESTMFHAQQTVCIWIGDDCHDFPDWSAAAEYTREHKEKVRQLRFDIAHVTRFRNAVGAYCHQHPYTTQTLEIEIPNLESWKRVLALLESELTRLTVGMKPEAL